MTPAARLRALRARFWGYAIVLVPATVLVLALLLAGPVGWAVLGLIVAGGER